jgi:hypothetical protein
VLAGEVSIFRGKDKAAPATEGTYKPRLMIFTREKTATSRHIVEDLAEYGKRTERKVSAVFLDLSSLYLNTRAS